MQAIQEEVKTQDRMFNGMKDKGDLVMEHPKAKEEVYVTIKGDIDVSKQQLSDIEEEREKSLADLCQFSSNQQIKTGGILPTFVTLISDKFFQFHVTSSA